MFNGSVGLSLYLIDRTIFSNSCLSLTPYWEPPKIISLFLSMKTFELSSSLLANVFNTYFFRSIIYCSWLWLTLSSPLILKGLPVLLKTLKLYVCVIAVGYVKYLCVCLKYGGNLHLDGFKQSKIKPFSFAFSTFPIVLALNLLSLHRR